MIEREFQTKEASAIEAGSAVVGGLTAKPDKHIHIQQAIESLEGLQDRAYSILGRINGTDQLAPSVNKERATMSLSDLLNEAPKMISGHCQSVYELLDQIEQSLF